MISRSKVKVIQRSSIYMTHRLIVIHPYAKYGMPTLKNKEVMARTRTNLHRQTDRKTYERYIVHFKDGAGLIADTGGFTSVL